MNNVHATNMVMAHEAVVVDTKEDTNNINNDISDDTNETNEVIHKDGTNKHAHHSKVSIIMTQSPMNDY